MPTAILKSWKMSGRRDGDETSTMVEGFIFEDGLGINTDGSFAKISNVLKIEEHSDYFLVHTNPCKYFLYRDSKAND